MSLGHAFGERCLCFSKELEGHVVDLVLDGQDDDPVEAVELDQGLHVHEHLEA